MDKLLDGYYFHGAIYGSYICNSDKILIPKFTERYSILKGEVYPDGECFVKMEILKSPTGIYAIPHFIFERIK